MGNKFISFRDLVKKRSFLGTPWFLSYPSLRVGLALLFGFLSYFFPLCIGFLGFLRSGKLLLIGFLACLFMYLSLPNASDIQVFGRLRPVRGGFQYFFEGRTENKSRVFVPVYVKSNKSKEQEAAAHFVKGRLQKDFQGRFFLTPKWQEPVSCQKVQDVCESYRTKLMKLALKPFEDSKVKAFYAGIFFGEAPSRSFFEPFARLGLAHILAISGFHFSLFGNILGCVFKVIQRRKRSWLILVVLFVYTLLIGKTPSILRAFIMAALIILGGIFRSAPSYPHVFGCALAASLLLDPFLIFSKAFQFSFGVTGSLVFFAPYFSEKLKKAGCRGFFYQEMLAVNIAALLTSLPLNLYHFGGFSIIGLVFNFFYPTLVALCMTLFIFFHVGVWFLPFETSFLFIGLEKFTSGVLSLVFEFPQMLDLWVERPFPSSFFIVLVALVLWKAHQISDRVRKDLQKKRSHLQSNFG